ncbi:DUF1810 domain-containing protein [Silvibacterium sp.]|uniref:DUF1810 domain-containing protein n=1 Tax=Silvibacterium sp. TaxID=1964179 RepID=UPI0039E53C13
MPGDSFRLQRFLDAQEPVYAQVVTELREGRKRSHWMWFIFPQIAGLGSSPTTQFFAISSLEAARAYLTHPVLGARLREVTAIVNSIEGRSAYAIFSTPDDLKFHSSITLFAQVAEAGSLFVTAIDKYFGGEADRKTLSLL